MSKVHFSVTVKPDGSLTLPAFAVRGLGLAAGDEVEAGFGPRRKADAEGRGELESAVAGAAQAHAHQQLADGVMRIFCKVGRSIKHCG